MDTNYGYKLELTTKVGDVATAALPDEFEGNGILVTFEYDADNDSNARLIRDAILFAHDGEGMIPTLSRRSKSVVNGIPQWDVVKTDAAEVATS